MQWPGTVRSSVHRQLVCRVCSICRDLQKFARTGQGRHRQSNDPGSAGSVALAWPLRGDRVNTNISRD